MNQSIDKARWLVAIVFVLFAVSAVTARPLSEYHNNVKRAVTALDGLVQADENESSSDYDARVNGTVTFVKEVLPHKQTVEWNGTTFTADNSWLHAELDAYLSAEHSKRAEALKRMTTRLQALSERLDEAERRATASGMSKAEQTRKLTEILQRPEYATKAKSQNALERLLERFMKWLRNFLPKPKPLSTGRADIITKIAQVVIVLLALGVLIFVLKMFLPRLWRSQKTAKKEKEKARIVLGERILPDQSARDILAEAEAMARSGDLRGAIRKAYIALLVELGDRKVISLAQHKTNRDYLRSIAEVKPLYGNVKELTDIFERHWYGLVNASETDWQSFRATYQQSLRA